MMKLKFNLTNIILGVLVIALATTSVMLMSGTDVQNQQDPAAAPNEAVPERVTLSDVQRQQIGITTANLAEQTVATTVSRTAEVATDATKSAQVAAGVAGIVRRIHAVQGDVVSVGAPLVTLDSSDLAVLQGAFLNANDRLELAEVSLNREKRLWEQKITSEEAYLESQRMYQEARINVRTAEQALQALGVDPKSVDEGRIGSVTLHSPIAGSVLSYAAFLGENVAADMPLFKVADLSSVWVQAQLYSTDLGRVAVGEPATILVSGSSVNLAGKVTQVVPNISDNTRTAIAIIVVDNLAQTLIPGQFVTAEIPLKEKRTAVLVPETALVRNTEGQWQIFIETETNTFAPTEITIDDRIAAGVLISGAPLGATVVTDGAFFLRAVLDKGSLVDDD